MADNNIKLKLGFILSFIAGSIFILEFIALSTSYGLVDGTLLSFSLLIISGLIIIISSLILLYFNKSNSAIGFVIIIFAAISLIARSFYQVYDDMYYVFNIITMIIGVIGGILMILSGSKN